MFWGSKFLYVDCQAKDVRNCDPKKGNTLCDGTSCHYGGGIGIVLYLFLLCILHCRSSSFRSLIHTNMDFQYVTVFDDGVSWYSN